MTVIIVRQNLSGFFQTIARKILLKMRGLNGFWMVYLKEPLKTVDDLNDFEAQVSSEEVINLKGQVGEAEK